MILIYEHNNARTTIDKVDRFTNRYFDNFNEDNARTPEESKMKYETIMKNLEEFELGLLGVEIINLFDERFVNYPIKKINIKRTNNEEIKLITCGEVFITNDEGKTISVLR